MLYGRLVHVGGTFNADLQKLGCELHKNAFGGRALPGPAGGAIALSQTPSRYKGDGKGKERVGNLLQFSAHFRTLLSDKANYRRCFDMRSEQVIIIIP